MTSAFRCPACGYERFTEHRLEVVQQSQSTTLRRERRGLVADDYLDAWEWHETATLFVNGYRCLGCEAIYSPAGERLSELLPDPEVYAREGAGGGAA